MDRSTTSHVRLRAVTETDLPTFFEQQLDPDANVMAAFMFRDPTDRDAFDAHWAKILPDDTIVKQTVLFDEQVAGYMVKFETDGEPEVGYWMGRDYWGKGIATAALAAFLRLITIRPLYAHAAKDNLGSIRVLEKCGFTRIGEARSFAGARGEDTVEVILQLAANDES